MGSDIKVGSMFAGIGGICLAFKRAGGKLVWANEIDKDACITYRHNFGDTYLVEGDVQAIPVDKVPDMDILTAGFPCQAFSVAGYQRGFNDDRGNMFFEITRILEQKKPRAIFLENVKNLLGHDSGNTFMVIKEQLELLGYHITFKVLNTMAYGNIPQTRERIYIVGFLCEADLEKFEFPAPLPLTKTIHDVADSKVKQAEAFYYHKTKYYDELKRTMTNKNTMYQWRRIYVRENKSNVCPTLTANMGTGGHNVPLILDDFGIRKLTPVECLGFQGFPADFTFPETISRTSCYKQAGNSVSVPVIERIANNIIEILK